MKNSIFLIACGLLCVATSLGCSRSETHAIEQTISPAEIAAMDAEYEAEMLAAENDTLGDS